MTAPAVSKLDHSQILPASFDDATGELRVKANVVSNIANPQEVIISADDDSIKISGRGGVVDTFTATHIGADVGLDVNIINDTPLSVSGEFTPSGLRTAGRNTTRLIIDSVAAIPLIPLVDRNSLTVTNLDPVETIYVGFDTSVTADSVVGTTSGFRLQPGESFSIDITDEVEIYGICETGKSAKVIITELA